MIALQLQEVANELRVSESFIRKLVSLDSIPHFRLGRRVLFDRAELDAWIEAKKVKASA